MYLLLSILTITGKFAKCSRPPTTTWTRACWCGTTSSCAWARSATLAGPTCLATNIMIWWHVMASPIFCSCWNWSRKRIAHGSWWLSLTTWVVKLLVYSSKHWRVTLQLDICYSWFWLLCFKKFCQAEEEGFVCMCINKHIDNSQSLCWAM